MYERYLVKQKGSGAWEQVAWPMFHPDVLAKIIKNEGTKPVQLTHRIFREKKMEFSLLSLIMPFIHIDYIVKPSLL